MISLIPLTRGKKRNQLLREKKHLIKSLFKKKNPENIKYLKRRAVKLWRIHGMEYDAVIKSNAKGGKRYILT